MLRLRKLYIEDDMKISNGKKVQEEEKEEEKYTY